MVEKSVGFGFAEHTLNFSQRHGHTQKHPLLWEESNGGTWKCWKLTHRT